MDYKTYNYKVIAAAVLVVAFIIFLIQNTAVVQIRFLAWEMSLSRSLVIVFGLVVGVAVGWVLHGYWRRMRGASRAGRR